MPALILPLNAAEVNRFGAQRTARLGAGQCFLAQHAA